MGRHGGALFHPLDPNGRAVPASCWCSSSAELLLPPKPAYDPPPLAPPPQTETAAVVAEGTGLYGRYCQRCHGANAAGGGLGETGPADRLYINMIKAGEAGGALEIILRRLAEFQEKAQSLKRKVKGAMVYPVVVVGIAVIILNLIMKFIVPKFKEIFADFDTELPAMTEWLIWFSDVVIRFFYLLPLIPIGVWLFVKLMRKFDAGRFGWDLFVLKVPVFGALVEKNTMARTSRTLGTLVASGVPILEALNIARETSGNAVFEKMYGRIYDAIREGESIARPMKENSKPGFHPLTCMFCSYLSADRSGC